VRIRCRRERSGGAGGMCGPRAPWLRRCACCGRGLGLGNKLIQGRGER
jgi:hypothetical protein